MQRSVEQVILQHYGPSVRDQFSDLCKQPLVTTNFGWFFDKKLVACDLPKFNPQVRRLVKMHGTNPDFQKDPSFLLSVYKKKYGSVSKHVVGLDVNEVVPDLVNAMHILKNTVRNDFSRCNLDKVIKTTGNIDKAMALVKLRQELIEANTMLSDEHKRQLETMFQPKDDTVVIERRCTRSMTRPRRSKRLKTNHT